MAQRWLLFGAAGMLALTAFACGDDDPGPSAPIFMTVPWEGEESYFYNLSQRGVESYGTCQLITEPGDETTTLIRLCSDEGSEEAEPGKLNRDDGEAEVDPTTLRPNTAQRTILNEDSGDRTTFVSTYFETEVRFEAQVNDDTNETTRDLPQPSEEEPNPAWYDDETLLWLVRGIPLEEEWTGVYHNVNASTGRVFKVEMEVEGRETVDVPAGEFEVWSVVVRSGGNSFRVWVEVDEPHRVIRAEVDRSAYELMDR